MPLTVEQNDMFRDEITEFVDAIQNDREPVVTLQESRLVLEVILATLKSLEEGKVVSL